MQNANTDKNQCFVPRLRDRASHWFAMLSVDIPQSVPRHLTPRRST
jgi:hypothetical protein